MQIDIGGKDKNMLKASDFLKPKNKYRRGTIHRVNWNRLFQNIDSTEWVAADHVMCNDHYGLIVSTTCTNVETAMIIPIKTNRGNINAYETMMDCCINDGHPSLLCIDQMSAIPLCAIDPTEFGEFRETTLNEVFRYIDIMMGRQNGSVPSKVTIEKDDLIQEENRKPEIPELKSSLNSYIYNHYQRNKDYLYRVRVSEIREAFNQVHEDQYAPVDEDTFERILGVLGFKVSTLHKERVIWGLTKKGIDVAKEIDSLNNEELMDKFCLSVSEAKELRRKLMRHPVENMESKYVKKSRSAARHKRLSESEWEEVITLYLEGDNIDEISNAYGVGKSTVYTHLNNAGVKLRR